ncbi:zinc finger MYM-type protein 1-like [Rhopilema esculentum]|uniref:zinc finger MYM-type protein 1-like n=1 Tax=Rhopilema esculentum TaxID=499914 RepID=UPI0031D2E493
MEWENSVESNSERDIFDQLLQKSFASRHVAEQKLIVNQRQTPKFGIKTRDRMFQEVLYEKKDWLCGSKCKKRLFCWPCLLFQSKLSKIWTETGYNNMQGFFSDCKKHEKAKSHLEAYKTWKTFDVAKRVDVLLWRARRQEIDRHNEEVRQNREMLKILSEATLFLGKQELSFRGHNESEGSLNKGNYLELLECLANFDSILEHRLHGRLADPKRASSGGVFKGVSSDVQNDLIECTDSVIQDQIDKEIQHCTFLSMQVDETTDVSTKEQLNIIVCLDRKGEIVEKLLKFVNVSQDRSAPAITAIVKNILSKYGESLKEKIVMQTYHGATVMSWHIGGVQTLLRQDYPFAYFFHCPFVKVFFASKSAFCNLTSLSSKRKTALTTKGIDIPSPGETR